ncbi:unnamed protein product, partial [Candidula unifasciata]
MLLYIHCIFRLFVVLINKFIGVVAIRDDSRTSSFRMLLLLIYRCCCFLYTDNLSKNLFTNALSTNPQRGLRGVRVATSVITDMLGKSEERAEVGAGG